MALLQHNMRELHKKVDLLMEVSLKTARDKLDEALVALDNENYRDAHEAFKSLGDKACEGFHLAPDITAKMLTTKMRILSHVMVKSFDGDQEAFIPFTYLTKIRQREIAMLMKDAVTKLLGSVDDNPRSNFGILRGRGAKKREQVVEKIKEVTPIVTSCCALKFHVLERSAAAGTDSCLSIHLIWSLLDVASDDNDKFRT